LAGQHRAHRLSVGSALPPHLRLPLLALGLAGLVVGVGAGLARLGVGVPAVAASAAAAHGPLMIGGFFGVVISLERAVAIGRRWAYAAPLLAGLGGVAAITGATAIASGLMLAGSLVLVAASLDILRRQLALFTSTMAVGAACWATGNFLWLLETPVHGVALWWLTFLVLTIAGERLELSRFMPPSRWAGRVFAGLLATIVAALCLGSSPLAQWSYAAALVGLAAWLVKQDIARRTIRGTGLTRYIAVCLLAGYAWLGAGGAIALFAGGFGPGTLAYDAAIHAIALGFVLSMVFGHAPIIVPAVMRVCLPYRPWFYLPLALLHLSVAIRVAGDALADHALRTTGGVLSACALLAFVACTVTAVLRGRAAARVARGPQLH
jgi:hypothetical protein